jgi:16S rRNA (adenine1518-N6/adenine1519-N6)-dimethyltransferase
MTLPVTWRQPQQLLKAHNLSPKKSFGQNFLVEETHLFGIARDVHQLFPLKTAPLQVVEYGGGLGALTEHLLNQQLNVHCVERDRDLIPILRSQFALASEQEQLHLYEADAAKFDLPHTNHKWVICGNLPYHLTSTLVLKTCAQAADVFGGVFLVQKEVAERIAAKEGNKDYSVLSVLVQSQFDAHISRYIPPGCFVPAPKVDSAVVVLRKNNKGFEASEKMVTLKRIVKQAFGQRRKTLRNNFKKDKDVQAHLVAMGVDLGLRPEALPVGTYLALVERLLQSH